MRLSATHHISFPLNGFSVKYRFPFTILRFFTIKSPSVTQRSVSQENAYKKSLNPSPFFHKTIGSYNSFTLIEKQFQVLKILKFEFKVTVHCGLLAKCSCDPLNEVFWDLTPRPVITSHTTKLLLGRGDKLENFDLIFSPLLQHGKGY